MRLFVAICPPPAALDDLAAAIAGLDLSAAAERGVNPRLTARQLWHVTLAFLGEVPDGRAADAATAVDRAVARAGDPMRLRIAGGGRFGRGRFTVLWVGLAGDVTPLRALAGAVSRELRRARLPCDDKPFRPHLTVARPGDRVGRETVDADLTRLAAYQGPDWTAGEVLLMRSHLGPRPVYDRLHAAPLPAASR